MIKLKSIKLVNIILFLLFGLFAVFQLNDPDPVHWVLIYGCVAIVCLLSNYIEIPKTLIWVLFFGLLIYSGIHFMYFMDWLQTDNKSEIFGEMVYEKPYLEGSREFLGLLMASAALIFQLRK